MNNIDYLNNLIKESRELSGIEEIQPDNWIPKIGDYIVITKPKNYRSWDVGMNAYIGACLLIISATNNYVKTKDNFWHWWYNDGHFRKALPHEIPY